VLSTLPSAVVAGQKAKGKVVVVMTNESSQAVAGPVTVQLFTSSDATVDAGDATLSMVTKKLKFKPGQARKLRMKLSAFPTVADGSYQLLAQIQAPDQTTSVAQAAAPITIAAPFVDVAASYAQPPAEPLTRGGKSRAVVEIQNLGNVPASEDTSVELNISSGSIQNPVDQRLAARQLKLNLKPNRSKRVNLKFTLPADIPAGSYFFVSAVIYGMGNEPELGNNSVSAGPLSVS
jgi:hypothetical protein